MNHNRRAGERRLADLSLTPEPAWNPGSAGETWRRCDPIPLGKGHRYMLRQDHDDRDRLVEFAIMQQRLVDGTWLDVIRYDTCEALEKGLHIHRFDSAGAEFSEEPVMPIKTQQDLHAALDHACEQMAQHWKTNLRRCERGR